MEEIRRRDRILFVRALLSGPSIMLIIAAIGLPFLTGLYTVAMFALSLVMMGTATGLAYTRSLRWRFHQSRYEVLWNACEDRLRRFRRAVNRMGPLRDSAFQELPNSVSRIADSVYVALRRADHLMHEVSRSEGWVLRDIARATLPPAQDRQAQELYKVADRNFQEYRNQFSAVVASAERTEAQAAVFISTLDSLRLKALGYRLTGKRGEMDSLEFLQAMSEAKMQLNAIDQALEELELTPFPKTVAIDPAADTPPLTTPISEEERREEENRP